MVSEERWQAEFFLTVDPDRSLLLISPLDGIHLELMNVGVC